MAQGVHMGKRENSSLWSAAYWDGFEHLVRKRALAAPTDLASWEIILQRVIVTLFVGQNRAIPYPWIFSDLLGTSLKGIYGCFDLLCRIIYGTFQVELVVSHANFYRLAFNEWIMTNFFYCILNNIPALLYSF